MCLYTSAVVMQESQFDQLYGLQRISVPWTKRCRRHYSSISSMRERLLKYWNLDSICNFDAYIFPERPKIPHVIWNPRSYHGVDKSPQLTPYPDSGEGGSPQIFSHPKTCDSLLIPYFNIYFTSSSSFKFFQQKLYTYFSSPPCVPQAPPLQFSLALL